MLISFTTTGNFYFPKRFTLIGTNKIYQKKTSKWFEEKPTIIMTEKGTDVNRNYATKF